MYTSIYFYSVPKKNIDAFLLVQRLSSDIYKKYGAIDDWTFAPECLSPKYGCASFTQVIPAKADEEIFFSLSLFRSKEDHDKIMSIVDSDPEIEKLFRQISDLIDLSKVIRGEFNRLI
jgi:uncharacterized protein YbaA (DUF1428 family)